MWAAFVTESWACWQADRRWWRLALPPLVLSTQGSASTLRSQLTDSHMVDERTENNCSCFWLFSSSVIRVLANASCWLSNFVSFKAKGLGNALIIQEQVSRWGKRGRHKKSPLIHLHKFKPKFLRLEDSFHKLLQPPKACYINHLQQLHHKTVTLHRMWRKQHISLTGDTQASLEGGPQKHPWPRSA